MKKLLLFAAVAASLTIFSACEKNNEENSFTQVSSFNAYNLFTALNANDNSAAATSAAKYQIVSKYPANTISIIANTLALPGGATSSFTTIEMPYQTYFVSVGDEPGYKFSSLVATEDGSVKNLNADIPAAIYGPSFTVPGYPYTQSDCLKMQYELDNEWLVRTFWSDMTFRGTTITNYPGAEEPYANDNINYRVIMQTNDKGAIKDKADVIFYNAKFAAPAPELKAIVLKDLALKFDNNGFKISGENIVPSVLMDGDQLIENKKFTFNEFSLSSTGDLIGATATFTVAGVYKGNFSGSSVAK